MANIDDELYTIKNEGKGENVRDAIISAIKKIHNEKEYHPTTLKVTKNGTTYDGGIWDKVVVDIDGVGVDYNNVDDMSQNHIKDNGYYTIKKLIDEGYISNPNCVGINGFYVDVPQGGDLGEIYISENGEYDPLLDGYDGYSKVYVNVFSTGKPGDICKLRFFDTNGNLIHQQQAPYGSDFAYNGKTPSSGGSFMCWNPNISRVSGDQDFYAVYKGSTSTGGVSIPDSWNDIVAKMKAGKMAYPVGSTKDLILTDKNGQTMRFIMILVGYRKDVTESGGAAFSTWMSYRPENDNIDNSIFTRVSMITSAELDADPNLIISWNNSLLRAALNGTGSEKTLNPKDLLAYNSLPYTVSELFANSGLTNLFNSIVPVRKYTSYNIKTSSGYIPAANLESIDKIWIPGAREMLNGIQSNYITSEGKYQYTNPYSGTNVAAAPTTKGPSYSDLLKCKSSLTNYEDTYPYGAYTLYMRSAGAVNSDFAVALRDIYRGNGQWTSYNMYQLCCDYTYKSVYLPPYDSDPVEYPFFERSTELPLSQSKYDTYANRKSVNICFCI